ISTPSWQVSPSTRSVDSRTTRSRGRRPAPTSPQATPAACRSTSRQRHASQPSPSRDQSSGRSGPRSACRANSRTMVAGGATAVSGSGSHGGSGTGDGARAVLRLVSLIVLTLRERAQIRLDDRRQPDLEGGAPPGPVDEPEVAVLRPRDAEAQRQAQAGAAGALPPPGAVGAREALEDVAAQRRRAAAALVR